MATVAAIFDDSVAMEKAVSSLQGAGLGDDIVEVDENRDADTAPEQSETPDNDDVGGIAPLGGAGGVIGGGGTGTHGTTSLLGGLFSGRDNRISGALAGLGDDAEPFRLAAERGGKIIVLETDDVDTAVTTLQRAGAQQVYDPR